MDPFDFTVMHSESSFNNPRNYKIFTQSWLPEHPTATFILLHGLGEYSDYFDHFARFLVSHNYAVYTLDHECTDIINNGPNGLSTHGRSKGNHVHVDSLQHLVDDAVTYAESVHDKHPDCPHFLLGFSMGGTIALSIGIQHPSLFDGSIVLAPSTIPSPSLIYIPLQFAKFVAKLFPYMRLISLDLSTLSRNPDIVERRREDPLIFKVPITFKFGVSILQYGRAAVDNASQYKMPLLMLQGDADRIVSPKGAAMFTEQCSSLDKAIIMLEGWMHDILNEPERDEIYRVIIEWVNSRRNLPSGDSFQISENCRAKTVDGKLKILK